MQLDCILLAVQLLANFGIGSYSYATPYPISDTEKLSLGLQNLPILPEVGRLRSPHPDKVCVCTKSLTLL